MLRFIGTMLKQDDVICYLVEFSFADIKAVYPDDDVMYIFDNVAIILSSVAIAQEF